MQWLSYHVLQYVMLGLEGYCNIYLFSYAFIL